MNPTSATASVSVYPDRRARRKPAEGPYAADAVPGVLLIRRLALAFIAFQEARHEELLRQRRQHDAAGLAVRDHFIRIVKIHDLQDRPRLRRGIGDLVA